MVSSQCDFPLVPDVMFGGYCHVFDANSQFFNELPVSKVIRGNPMSYLCFASTGTFLIETDTERSLGTWASIHFTTIFGVNTAKQRNLSYPNRVVKGIHTKMWRPEIELCKRSTWEANNLKFTGRQCSDGVGDFSQIFNRDEQQLDDHSIWEMPLAGKHSKTRMNGKCNEPWVRFRKYSSARRAMFQTQ